ncbi:MAG TPA: alpha/beta hydrolase [Thermoleophilaceae bacterium]|nr:alpha/beta hydrolase [Thermoleophilaceae bacterium]
MRTLFLHGLAGHGSEWDELQARFPAEAPDLRQYGTRDDYVADVVGWIGSDPVLLIGQSLGGHTAMLVAVRHPELVERLVVIEASPERDPGARDRARTFFEANPGHYGEPIDAASAAACLDEIAERDFWDEWRSISCPVLVVRAEHGGHGAGVVERMTRENPHARSVVIAEAGHDVHLDQPGALADAIQEWLSTSAT